MRLHRLELTAFQAFAGHEVVDFDALAESGLFLMHGPTGAGKTTILDAVCFAFYGRLPGARSEGVRLRSDHAAPGDLTVVTLEATLRGQRVRIRRQPEQERPKVRGEGTTVDGARVQVWAIDEDGGERILATRIDEARQELGDLLGMTAAQFSQIVLLPQGGFANFLHAKSDQRRDVLSELFDVDRFVGAERWLADRRSEARAAVEEALAEVADAVSRVAQVAAAEEPEGWRDDLSVLPGWSAGLTVVAEADLATAASSAERTAATLALATAALEAGKALNGRRQKLRDARRALAGWEADRPVRDAADAELQTARRAAAVAPLLATLASREAVLERLAPAEGDPAALRAQADRARHAAGEVSALAAVEERCAATGAELTRLRARAEAAARTRAEHETWLEGAGERRAELAAAAEMARDAEMRLPELAAACDRARAAHREAGVRDRLIALVAGAEAVAERARETDLTAREHRVDVERRRLDGMASVLGGELTDGEPCAVCGGVEHPRPATAPDGTVPGEDELERARAAADRAGEARELALAEAGRLTAALSAARKVAGDVPLETLAGTLDAALRKHTVCASLAAGAREAATLLVRHDAGTAEHEAARVEAGRQLDRAEEAAERAEESRMADVERIVRQLEGHPTVADRVAALERAAGAATARAEAVEARERAAAEAADARGAVERGVVGAGFAGVAEARAAVRDEAAQTELQARVRAWDARLAELSGLTRQPDLVEAAEQQGADLVALGLHHRETQEIDRTAQATLGAARGRHEALEALRATLVERVDTAAPAVERLALVREVADLADGKGANRQRIRLSSYVLAARLEEVASAATVRLARMSQGRYALEHATEGATNRGQAGLNLCVVDAWTGRTRSPASLSGGETFLASLALALGLADVVAAEAGGARLETLFVDEGFGSLDDEGTLDQVLDVLDDLRDSGRVIGVVSHVAELRSRIPGRLQIVKTQQGSHVEQPQAVA